MTENATRPQELLETIRQFVETAKAHVAEGGEAELTGLDAKVQELCEAVLDMPKSEADNYSKPLQQLAEDLTVLKVEMETTQAEIRQQLDALNLRHKAAKAYKTTEGSAPPPPPGKPDKE